VQQMMFLLFVHEELNYFSSDLIKKKNSLGNSLSVKCIALLCSYFYFLFKKGEISNFKLFYFSSNLMHFFCKRSYLWIIDEH